MKVILKEGLSNLGESGTIVDVKPGYARNYLLPQGLAYVASDDNLARLEEEQRLAEEGAKRDYLEARRRASQVESTSITFAVNAGEEGKLFGSVTSADIAERLNAEGGFDFQVDKKAVLLEDPIKELGSFQVAIKLHGDVAPEVEVVVVASEA